MVLIFESMDKEVVEADEVVVVVTRGAIVK